MIRSRLSLVFFAGAAIALIGCDRTELESARDTGIQADMARGQGGAGGEAGAGGAGGEGGQAGAGAAGGLGGEGGSGGAGGEAGAGGGMPDAGITPDAGALAATLPLGEVVASRDCTNANLGECQRLTVQCPGQPDLEVTVQIASPEGEVRGTVIVGSGGAGTTPYSVQVIQGLQRAGFRVLHRVWADTWEHGAGGTAATACRYATLTTWARGEWAEGPLCVTGNSGGSAEISYALARYGRDSVIDFAVPTSGPPMSRIDLGCIGGDEWTNVCMNALPADHCADNRGRICDFNGGNRALFDGGFEGTPCADGDPAASGILRAGSVLSEDAVLSYPTTPVHFILGREDCTSAMPHAMLFHDAITSEKTITWVDAPHAMQRDPEGVVAIIDTLTSGCVER
mgnify:CR=1 FL=1